MSNRERTRQAKRLLRENGVAEAFIGYKANGEEKEQVIDSRGAYKILQPFFEQFIDHREVAYVMLLNRNNKVNGVVKISEGGVMGTVIDPVLVMQAVILSNSVGFMIAHNHPSGNNKPSDLDVQLTNELKQAAKFMRVNMLDHIIICRNRYYSFADEGRMS